ncbi:hypothetical protein GCM10027408_18520 [Microbacterium tumbae]
MRFPTVIGIEPDSTTAAIAARTTQGSPTVRIERRAFGQDRAQAYDLIAFFASLHPDGSGGDAS